MTATDPAIPVVRPPRPRIPFPRIDPDLADSILSMSLRSVEHPEARRPTRPLGSSCRWCTHAWHGSTCTHESHSAAACRCESSFTTRDDTWRPRYVDSWAFRAERLMDVTGVDGYSAKWLTTTPGVNMPHVARQQRLRDAVLQGAQFS